MSTICSTGCRGTTSTTSDGTSTNCSAICVAARAARRGQDRHKILPPVGPPSAAQVHENLHHGSEVHRGKVDDVLHGVPLYPLLRPRLSEGLGPHSAGLFLVQPEELRLGGRREGVSLGSSPCSSSRSPPPLPGPVRPLTS